MGIVEIALFLVLVYVGYTAARLFHLTGSPAG